MGLREPMKMAQPNAARRIDIHACTVAQGKLSILSDAEKEAYIAHPESQCAPPVRPAK